MLNIVCVMIMRHVLPDFGGIVTLKITLKFVSITK